MRVSVDKQTKFQGTCVTKVTAPPKKTCLSDVKKYHVRSFK